jgi:hypothetical protein
MNESTDKKKKKKDLSLFDPLFAIKLFLNV